VDDLQSVKEEEEIPPDYIFDLIQVSILAEAGDVPGLLAAIEQARAKGAENKEILRAMFRSDEAFGSGIESVEFLRLAESLQAGAIPLTQPNQFAIV
jgi:hypothetical protein